jgi:hypothetical protein
MATAPVFLGDFRKGDNVQFAIDNPSAGWLANTYSVFDNDSKRLVVEDVPLVVVTDFPDVAWVDLLIVDSFDTDSQRFFTWVEGRTYSILVKADNTDGDSFMAHFRVAPGERRAFLGVVEKGKDFHFMHREENRSELWYDVIDAKTGTAFAQNEAMTGPMLPPGGVRFFRASIETEGTDDLAIGRTYWIRVKDKRAEDPNLDWLYSFTVIPRLEYDLTRLLAYAGENMVLDNFTYDQAGNILGLRVRAFSNSEDADRATAGVTDPEPGEISALTVTQEHNVPRNVRTFHKSVQEFLSSSFPKEQ